MGDADSPQATTLQERVWSIEQVWMGSKGLARKRRVPERMVPALYDAVFGYCPRRRTHVDPLADAGITSSEQTTTLDFSALAAAGLPEPHGDKRGHDFTSARSLKELHDASRAGRAPRVPCDVFFADVAE